MNEEIENYLGKVSFYLLGVKRSERKEIIEELRNHLTEKAQAFGNFSAENIKKAIEEFGSPKELAYKYKELYGYSSAWLCWFAVFAAVISALTLPTLEYLSMIFLPLAFLYIVYMSLVAGRKAGIVIGAVCGATRILLLGLLLAFYPAAYGIQNSFATIPAFCFVSIIMAMLGYIPSYYKEKYKKSAGESFI
ncbi:MAG: DUF1700 domain-containing protein [Candidatus Thermoplasmatota archaeon]|nr:DUF1700 domain-containing protein [Candidatus Thermoplasmatota archaeon]MDI6855708.1 DUF1700 domain-containing protein [Candidatus Thermoplasmatota archaeon]